MKEYEYSFKVESLKPYIDYAVNNGYEEISNNDEIRDLYSNDSSKIARLTYINDSIILDFKEKGDTSIILKEREESEPIQANKEEKETILSILDVLNYKMINHLERKRIVYKKNNVKFELDSYTYPNKEFIVGIEGKKEEVDKVYNELKQS